MKARPLSERLPLLGGGVGSILAIILVVALIGTGGSLLAGVGGADDPADFYDDYLEDYEQSGDITVSEVVDPWTPEDGDDGSPADRRRIAIEVLIEADPASEVGYYVYSYDFQLKDSENFVYAPVDYGEPQAQPPLPDVDLQPGEKARGWVTFEVAEGSEIVSLTAGTKEIDLP